MFMSQGGKKPFRCNETLPLSLLRPKSGPEAAWRQVPSTEPREVGIRSGAGCRAFEERRREKNTGRARRGAGGDSGGVVENHRDDTSIHEKLFGEENVTAYVFLSQEKGMKAWCQWISLTH